MIITLHFSSKYHLANIFFKHLYFSRNSFSKKVSFLLSSERIHISSEMLFYTFTFTQYHTFSSTYFKNINKQFLYVYNFFFFMSISITHYTSTRCNPTTSPPPPLQDPCNPPYMSPLLHPCFNPFLVTPFYPAL